MFSFIGDSITNIRIFGDRINKQKVTGTSGNLESIEEETDQTMTEDEILKKCGDYSSMGLYTVSGGNKDAPAWIDQRKLIQNNLSREKTTTFINTHCVDSSYNTKIENVANKTSNLAIKSSVMINTFNVIINIMKVAVGVSLLLAVVTAAAAAAAFFIGLGSSVFLTPMALMVSIVTFLTFKIKNLVAYEIANPYNGQITNQIIEANTLYKTKLLYNKIFKKPKQLSSIIQSTPTTFIFNNISYNSKNISKQNGHYYEQGSTSIIEGLNDDTLIMSDEEYTSEEILNGSVNSSIIPNINEKRLLLINLYKIVGSDNFEKLAQQERFNILDDDQGNNKMNNIRPFINKVSRKLWNYNYDTLLTAKNSKSINDGSFKSLQQIRNFRFKIDKGDLVNNYKENLNFVKSLSDISPEILNNSNIFNDKDIEEIKYLNTVSNKFNYNNISQEGLAEMLSITKKLNKFKDRINEAIDKSEDIKTELNNFNIQQLIENPDTAKIHYGSSSIPVLLANAIQADLKKDNPSEEGLENKRTILMAKYKNTNKMFENSSKFIRLIQSNFNENMKGSLHQCWSHTINPLAEFEKKNKEKPWWRIIAPAWDKTIGNITSLKIDKQKSIEDLLREEEHIIREKYKTLLGDNPESEAKATEEIEHIRNLKIFLCKEFYYKINGYKQITNNILSLDNLPAPSNSNEMLKLCKDVISPESSDMPPPPVPAPKIINNKGIIKDLLTSLNPTEQSRNRMQSDFKIKKLIKAINENWGEKERPQDIHYLDQDEQIEWIMYHTNKDNISIIPGLKDQDDIVQGFNKMFEDSQFTSLKEYCNECIKAEGGCELNNEGISICTKWEEKIVKLNNKLLDFNEVRRRNNKYVQELIKTKDPSELIITGDKISIKSNKEDKYIIFRNVHDIEERDIIVLNKKFNDEFSSEIFNQIGSNNQRQELLTKIYEHISSKGDNLNINLTVDAIKDIFMDDRFVAYHTHFSQDDNVKEFLYKYLLFYSKNVKYQKQFRKDTVSIPELTSDSVRNIKLFANKINGVLNGDNRFPDEATLRYTSRTVPYLHRDWNKLMYEGTQTVTLESGSIYQDDQIVTGEDRDYVRKIKNSGTFIYKNNPNGAQAQLQFKKLKDNSSLIDGIDDTVWSLDEKEDKKLVYPPLIVTDTNDWPSKLKGKRYVRLNINLLDEKTTKKYKCAKYKFSRGPDAEYNCPSLEEYSNINNLGQSGGGWWDNLKEYGDTLKTNAKKYVTNIKTKVKDTVVEKGTQLRNTLIEKGTQLRDTLIEKGNKLIFRKCDEWDCNNYTIDIPESVQHILNKLTDGNTGKKSVLWVSQDIFSKFIKDFGEGDQTGPSFGNPGLLEHEFTFSTTTESEDMIFNGIKVENLDKYNEPLRKKMPTEFTVKNINYKS